MIILFPRWDMLVPWRVFPPNNRLQCRLNRGFCKKIPPCQGGKHQQFGTSSVASEIFHRTSNRNNILSTKIAIIHHLSQIGNLSHSFAKTGKNPKETAYNSIYLPTTSFGGLGDITTHITFTRLTLKLQHGMAMGIGDLTKIFISTKIPTLQEMDTYPTKREVGKIIDSKWTFFLGYVSY